MLCLLPFEILCLSKLSIPRSWISGYFRISRGCRTANAGESSSFRNGAKWHFDPPVLSQVLQSPDFREKGGVGRRIQCATKLWESQTSLEHMIGLQEHRRKIHFFSSNICRPYLKSPIFKVRSTQHVLLGLFPSQAVNLWWVFMSEVDDLWVVGIGSGRKPGMFQPFPKTNPAQAESAVGICWLQPSGTHLLAFTPKWSWFAGDSNVLNRTGGCFLKAYIGVDFYETKPTFCAIFHVWPLSDSHNFCSPVSLFVPIQSSMIFGGPSDLISGLETMGSKLRTLGTACSSCTAISACGLQEFRWRLSWHNLWVLGGAICWMIFPCIFRKILNEERFRSPESSTLQGWYKWLSRKLTCEGVPVTQWSNCSVEKWDAWYVYVVNIYLKIQSFYEDEVGSIDADLRRRCMEAKWVWLDRDR